MLRSVYKNMNKQISVNLNFRNTKLLDDHAILSYSPLNINWLWVVQSARVICTLYTIIDENILKNKLRSMDWGSLLTSTVNNKNINKKYERVITTISTAASGWSNKNNKN